MILCRCDSPDLHFVADGGGQRRFCMKCWEWWDPRPLPLMPQSTASLHQFLKSTNMDELRMAPAKRTELLQYALKSQGQAATTTFKTAKSMGFTGTLAEWRKLVDSRPAN